MFTSLPIRTLAVCTFTALLCLFLTGCEESNLLEPSLFSTQDHSDLSVCQPDDSSFHFDPDSGYTGPDSITSVPTKYALEGVCWQDQSKRTILVKFITPQDGHVQLFLYKRLCAETISGTQAIQSPWTLVKVLYDRQLQAGCWAQDWDLKTPQGRKMGEGIYGVILIAGDFKESLWFHLQKGES
jgi:hypothetical protein